MTKLLSAFGLALTMAMTLTGCELYFGPDDDGRPSTATPGGGGWSCESDADCAAGCYCETSGLSTDTGGAASGVCEEAGFCDDDSDCPDGFVCDDRSSCVPGTTCESSADCPAGSLCNNGQCEASCVCESDADAQAAGYHHCDEARNTCETANPAGTCGGDATCGTRPACAAGSVALIGADGCYTGACETITPGCDVAPTCGSLQHETDCLARTGECGALYTGINCKKPDGTACQSGDTGCTCESFRFAACDEQSSARHSNQMVMDRYGRYIDISPLLGK